MLSNLYPVLNRIIFTLLMGVTVLSNMHAQTFNEIANGSHNMSGFAASLATTTGQFILADIEGDGDMDLIGRPPTLPGAPVFWRHNGNTSQWTQLTGASNPFAAITISAVADFTQQNLAVLDADGDGDVDIYSRGNNTLYRNNSGIFNAVTGSSNPMDAIAATLANASGTFLTGDFDGDGDKDLVGRNTGNTGLVYWRNNFNGTWTQLTGASNPFNSVSIAAAGDFSFTNLALVDADGNGSIDIYNKGNNTLIRNTANTYSVVSGASNPMDAIAASLTSFAAAFITSDFDSDGDLDLIGRNTANTGIVYWRKDAGSTWTQLTGTNNPFNSIVLTSNADFTQASVAALDADKDGDMDVYNHAKQAKYRQVGVAPALQSFTPAKDATNIAVNTNLTLTFSEAVKLGTGGTGTGSLVGTGDIVVFRASDNAVIERINVVTNAGLISGTGTTTLTINPASNLPGGTQVYVLIGGNAILSDATNLVFQGVSQTDVIRFTTTALPVITTQPVAVNSCSPLPVQFSVAATGTGLSYQWQQSNDAGFSAPATISNTGVFSGATSAILSISDNTALHGKYFRCVVSNGGGSVTSNAALLSVGTTALPSGSLSLTQNVSNNLYQNGSCQLLGKVVPNGASPVSGNVTFKVWNLPEAGIHNGVYYGRRFYEVTPAANASTATARVTLHFTQADFDDFNAVGALQLPTGPSDAAGKANLRISKLSGTSSNGTGLPQSYSGARELINPADVDIVWNSSLNLWEVSFDVTGFSGFFVQTHLVVLPVRLVSFTAAGKDNGRVQLNWTVAEQNGMVKYEIQRSTHPARFEKAGELQAGSAAAQAYSYVDQTPEPRVWYYRLKMYDRNGDITYSQVVAVDQRRSGMSLSVHPNPVRGQLQVNAVNLDKAMNVRLLNMQGQVLKQFVMNGATYQLDMSGLANGIYQLSFDNGTLIRVVKQ